MHIFTQALRYTSAICLLIASSTAVTAAPTKWIGQVGEYRLEVSQDSFKQLTPTPQNLLPILESMGDEELLCEAERSVRLKSWVGTLVSFEQEDHWNCLTTAHPGAYTQVKTYNLTTGAPLKLTDIFPDKQVLQALLADKIVKKNLSPGSSGQFSSSQQLVDYLTHNGVGECAYTFGSDSLTNFYFHHIRNNQVAVRLGLSHGCEAARGNLTELGLYLPIPTAWSSSFKNAQQATHGFLAQNNPVKKYPLHQRVKDPGYDKALDALMAD